MPYAIQELRGATAAPSPGQPSLDRPQPVRPPGSPVSWRQQALTRSQRRITAWASAVLFLSFSMVTALLADSKALASSVSMPSSRSELTRWAARNSDSIVEGRVEKVTFGVQPYDDGWNYVAYGVSQFQMLKGSPVPATMTIHVLDTDQYARSLEAGKRYVFFSRECDGPVFIDVGRLLWGEVDGSVLHARHPEFTGSWSAFTDSVLAYVGDTDPIRFADTHRVTGIKGKIVDVDLLGAPPHWLSGTVSLTRDAAWGEMASSLADTVSIDLPPPDDAAVAELPTFSLGDSCIVLVSGASPPLRLANGRFSKFEIVGDSLYIAPMGDGCSKGMRSTGYSVVDLVGVLDKP
ncbi:MAG: hypothetical protein H6682_10230 [Candidatus Eisenbacteria bacterium]|nr:hypothetical protein [Candidatus Eisenbacteria bacterium]